MNNTNTDEDEILKNNPDDTDNDTTVDTNENDDNDNSDEDVETLKQRLQKAEANYQSQKTRAEKAEAQAKAKPASKGETYKKGNELSAFDLIAVTKADIDEDTLSEVMDYAKYKNISISEALKSSVVKATIAEKSENKRMAEATNTGNARRGTSKADDYTLLENARKGIMPESESDMKRLIQIRNKNR